MRGPRGAAGHLDPRGGPDPSNRFPELNRRPAINNWQRSVLDADLNYGGGRASSTHPGWTLVRCCPYLELAAAIPTPSAGLLSLASIAEGTPYSDGLDPWCSFFSERADTVRGAHGVLSAVRVTMTEPSRGV